MRVVKLLLIFFVTFTVLPGRAADKAAQENTEAQENENPSERVKRPKREAIKISPSIRQSPPRPDESGKMRRVAPPRDKSPLQNVPALKDPPPAASGDVPANR